MSVWCRARQHNNCPLTTTLFSNIWIHPDSNCNHLCSIKHSDNKTLSCRLSLLYVQIVIATIACLTEVMWVLKRRIPTCDVSVVVFVLLIGGIYDKDTQQVAHPRQHYRWCHHHNPSVYYFHSLYRGLLLGFGQISLYFSLSFYQDGLRKFLFFLSRL